MKAYLSLTRPVKAARFLGFVLALSVWILPGRANTIYTYQGSDYTTVTSPFTTSMAASGDFTTASPLVPNLAYSLVTPLTFDFTDGLNDYTNLNATSSTFYIWTDSSGEITDWIIGLQVIVSPFNGYTQHGSLLIRGEDEGPGDNVSYYFFANGFVYSTYDAYTLTPGTWTQGFSPAPTPELPTAALVVTAFLAFGLLTLKRKLLGGSPVLGPPNAE